MFGTTTKARIKTYLFGVAIGSVLVALILLAKADQSRREFAAAEAANTAAARAASQNADTATPGPAPR